MQQVLRQSRSLDPEAAKWFEVIDRFDSALASRASMEALLRLAADITGRPTGLRDELSGLTLGVDSGSIVEAEALSGAEVSREVVTNRLRGRSAARVSLSEGSAIAASVEVGAGRVGVAWTLGAKRARWRPLDYLVTERLATALSATTLAKRSRADAKRSGEPSAVERLLSGGLSEQELARIARHAKIAIDGAYVAIAVEQSPPNAVTAEALGSIVERALRDRGALARAGVLGRMAGLIVSQNGAVPNVLTAVRHAATGFDIRLGVGDAVDLAQLPVSFEHASEALALGSLSGRGDSQVVFFDDLGVLHLLAQIPTSEVLSSKLFHALNDSLSHRGAPSDIDVLEAYLEEGTLRRAAARVFLHHTTVEHRLKRIQGQLGLDLSLPAARFQVQLLLKLQRIVHMQDRSRA